MEVLKLQSRIEDKLRPPSYYITISTYDQSAVNIYDHVKSCKRLNLHKCMFLLLKSSIVNFTFCTTSRYDKYSKHVNSSEI